MLDAFTTVRVQEVDDNPFTIPTPLLVSANSAFNQLPEPLQNMISGVSNYTPILLDLTADYFYIRAMLDIARNAIDRLGLEDYPVLLFYIVSTLVLFLLDHLKENYYQGRYGTLEDQFGTNSQMREVDRQDPLSDDSFNQYRIRSMNRFFSDESIPRVRFVPQAPPLITEERFTELRDLIKKGDEKAQRELDQVGLVLSPSR